MCVAGRMGAAYVLILRRTTVCFTVNTQCCDTYNSNIDTNDSTITNIVKDVYDLKQKKHQQSLRSVVHKLAAKESGSPTNRVPREQREREARYDRHNDKCSRQSRAFFLLSIEVTLGSCFRCDTVQYQHLALKRTHTQQQRNNE